MFAFVMWCGSFWCILFVVAVSYRTESVIFILKHFKKLFKKLFCWTVVFSSQLQPILAKKFTIFVNFKFSKQLRYSVIFYKHQAALFRLHLPFSTRDATRLHSLEPRAASFTLLSGNQAFDHLQFSIAFYK